MGQNCEEDPFCGVNKPESRDPEDMNDLERKHTSVIKAPERVRKGEEFEVEVRLGGIWNIPMNTGISFNGWSFIPEALF